MEHRIDRTLCGWAPSQRDNLFCACSCTNPMPLMKDWPKATASGSAAQAVKMAILNQQLAGNAYPPRSVVTIRQPQLRHSRRRRMPSTTGLV
jgi:hypothetical protein